MNSFRFTDLKTTPFTCRMWWTITGNFGNILPIDWSKSYTRQMHMPTLNLGQNHTKQQQQNRNQQQQLHNQSHQAYPHTNGLGSGSGSGLDAQTPGDEFNDLTSEDEAVANDLDMHALILNGLNGDMDDQPIKTVEEVIKEIDDIMDEAESPLDEPETCDSEVIEKAREVLGAPLYAESKQATTSWMPVTQINIIRTFSCRTAISDHDTAERAVHGDGGADPGAERDVDQRAGPARRAGVREGAEELVHLSAPRRSEQKAAVPCGEEARQVPG